MNRRIGGNGRILALFLCVTILCLGVQSWLFSGSSKPSDRRASKDLEFNRLHNSVIHTQERVTVLETESLDIRELLLTARADLAATKRLAFETDAALQQLMTQYRAFVNDVRTELRTLSQLGDDVPTLQARLAAAEEMVHRATPVLRTEMDSKASHVQSLLEADIRDAVARLSRRLDNLEVGIDTAKQAARSAERLASAIDIQAERTPPRQSESKRAPVAAKDDVEPRTKRSTKGKDRIKAVAPTKEHVDASDGKTRGARPAEDEGMRRPTRDSTPAHFRVPDQKDAVGGGRAASRFSSPSRLGAEMEEPQDAIPSEVEDQQMFGGRRGDATDGVFRSGFGDNGGAAELDDAGADDGGDAGADDGGDAGFEDGGDPGFEDGGDADADVGGADLDDELRHLR